MIRNAIGKCILALCAWLLSASPALAGPGVTATARPASVAVGEPFQVEVRLQSTGLSSGGDLVVPTPQGLERLGTRSSDSMKVINGQATRERIEIHNFRASQPGRYRFDGLGVRKGSQFTPAPIVTVTVRGPQDPAVVQSAPAAPAVGTRGELPGTPPLGSQDVHVTAFVDRDEVWSGEPIVYTFRFYFRVSPDGPTYDAPDFAGFQHYDLGQSKDPESVTIDGRHFYYYDLKTLLYPLRTGDLQIATAGLTFRRSLFFSQSRQLRTDPVSVRVRPLPGGAPRGFHGAVGAFGLTGGRVPQNVSAGEPMEHTLTITGTGNFGSVDAPVALESESWRFYPGRTEEEVTATELGLQGKKRFDMLLLPPDEPRAKLPEFQFVFFNVARERYETLTLPGAEVEVRPALPGLSATAPETMLALRPLRTELGAPLPNPLTPWMLLLWLIPLPVLAWVVLGAGDRVRRRMAEVTPADRKAAARRRLERVAGDQKADAAELLKAVDLWLHETQGLPMAPTQEEISAKLGEAAEPLLAARRQLEQTAFGGGAERQGGRRLLREWLRRYGSLLMLVVALGVTAASGLAIAANAEMASQLFGRAQKMQEQADFAEATRLYLRAGEQGVNHLNVLYNLAGAAWRAGEPGLARLSIERAMAFAPRSSDVRANRDLIAGAVASQGGSARSLQRGWLSLGETGWLAVGAYVLFTLLSILAWRYRRIRLPAVAALLLALGLFGWGGFLYDSTVRHVPGVIWTDTGLREAADSRSAQSAALPAGDLGRLVDARGDWLQIKTFGGLTGWIPQSAWRPLGLSSLDQGIPQ
jgi:hypothetical protein